MIWCAEVGSAHKGSKSLAYEYIRAFSDAGANVVKFQFGWTKEAQKKYAGNYNEIRFIDDWAPDLKKWCDSFGVGLMASIWSEVGLEKAKIIGLNYYKIGAQMDDEELIMRIRMASAGYQNRYLYRSGKDVFCVSKYPTYPEELKLPRFGGGSYKGYSDHTHGIEACLLAVSRGASYIEKHVCLDKSDLVTRDTPFSATPGEFSEMVRIGTGMRRLLDAGV